MVLCDESSDPPHVALAINFAAALESDPFDILEIEDVVELAWAKLCDEMVSL